MTPLVRSPDGPELLRGSEVVRVAVVSPSASERKPEVKPEEVPVVKSQRQEKAVDVENIFRKMNEEKATSRSEKSPPAETLKMVDTSDVPPPPKVGDDDVFWEDLDPLPPPPPEIEQLESSQDNVPLPSPPKEVLLGLQPQRKDREDIALNLLGNNFEREPVDDKFENKENESTVKDENAKNVAVSEHVEPLETSIDFAEVDWVPERSRRASPPPPLVITSTPTNDEPPQVDTNLDSSASPMNTGSTLSTPSGSRPNSMLSPKIEALDKEKVRIECNCCCCCCCCYYYYYYYYYYYN